MLVSIAQGKAQFFYQQEALEGKESSKKDILCF